MMTSTTAAVILSLLASSAFAGPVAMPLYPRQAATCNTHPAGTSSANPLATPSAATAQACLQQCEANTQCQSFVFGLPSGASAPQCKLFAVAGAQVPAQPDTNLMVFDKGCSGVPTAAPTASNPVGEPNGNGQQRKGASKRQGQQGGSPAQNTGSGSQNAGNNNNNNGNTNSGNTNSGSTKTGSTSQVCGAAPSGPSTNSPTALKTDTSITTQNACLQLCQQTSGCESCEFGKPSSTGADQCKLFSVAASQLPPNGSGATFVAYDTGC